MLRQPEDPFMVKRCVELGEIVAADPDSNNFFNIVGNEVVEFPHVDSCAAVMVKTKANGYYLYHSLYCVSFDTPDQMLGGEVVAAMLVDNPFNGTIERTVVIASDAWEDAPTLPAVLTDCHVNYCSKAVDIELDTGATRLRIRKYSSDGTVNPWSPWFCFITFMADTTHPGT